MKALIELTKTLYKHVDIEIQYLIYKLNGSWKAEQISSNGTPNSADLINEYLTDAILNIKENGVKEVYIVHNHPIANPKPSFMDYYNHKTIESFLRLSGLKALDYLIVSPYGYYSFKEDGRMDNTPSFEEAGEVIPLQFALGSLSEVNEKKHEIMELLSQYDEVMITPEGSFAGSKLNFTKLFKNFEEIKGNHLFFSKCMSDEYLSRLNDIQKVFSPIEIFSTQHQDFIPLIVSGVIE